MARICRSRLPPDGLATVTVLGSPGRWGRFWRFRTARPFYFASGHKPNEPVRPE